MKEKIQDKSSAVDIKVTEKKLELDWYPMYPVDEDIYNRNMEEENLDPEDVTKKKQPNENDAFALESEKNFEEDESGDDLDVPGTELDDELEDIGSEDEENNYYSLGGDDHNNLDEDRD
jgi:hypothetical protein